MYRHSLLFILLMGSTMQAHAFFCFSFGTSSGGRSSPAFSRRPPPPPPLPGYGYVNPYFHPGTPIPGYNQPWQFPRAETGGQNSLKAGQ
ncbi:MAG: hypothetical protein ABW116_16255 [Candidatus Sedimenticola sp. 20ELBAFRAG]